MRQYKHRCRVSSASGRVRCQSRCSNPPSIPPAFFGNTRHECRNQASQVLGSNIDYAPQSRHLSEGGDGLSFRALQEEQPGQQITFGLPISKLASYALYQSHRETMSRSRQEAPLEQQSKPGDRWAQRSHQHGPRLQGVWPIRKRPTQFPRSGSHPAVANVDASSLDADLK